MSGPVFVSYFTNSLYERFSTPLRESLERLGLKCDIEASHDLGTPTANKNHKPAFILKKLEEHGEDVVWLDVDSRAWTSPEILLQSPDCDLAGCFWHEWFCYGGTLYFRNSRPSRELLDLWKAETLEHPQFADDQNLTHVLLRKPPVRVLHLPGTYRWIKRLNPGLEPSVHAVIEHYEVGTHPECAQEPASCEVTDAPRVDP